MPRIAYLTEQAELQWQRRLDRLRSLVKLGPGLGLMGTLIPLGPALVGLAVGDIQTMSNNLVIAFSTTVIGLFIGLVAGFLVSLKKHWCQSDAALLNFAAERLITRNTLQLDNASADPASPMGSDRVAKVAEIVAKLESQEVPLLKSLAHQTGEAANV